jgi:hypothetical protein
MISPRGGGAGESARAGASIDLGTRVLTPGAAAYLAGFQVQADPRGVFTFGVRRPTGAAAGVITAADDTGVRAGGLTDYGNGGTVQAGYLLFANAEYTAGLGWNPAGPLPGALTPGGSGATQLHQDAVSGGYAPSKFFLDVPSATGTHLVTVTLGDLSVRRATCSWG